MQYALSLWLGPDWAFAFGIFFHVFICIADVIVVESVVFIIIIVSEWFLPEACSELYSMNFCGILDSIFGKALNLNTISSFIFHFSQKHKQIT